MSYLPRISDSELSTALQSVGAVLIEGPRACGKTATARQASRSEVLLDVDPGARRAAAVDPSLILPGPSPRLIDEWQLEPAIWNHVRRAVDERGGAGHFILTGSSVPSDDESRHVGAGRFLRLRMRPMTLSELGTSTRQVSLADLLSGGTPAASDTGLSVSDIASVVCAGGWPGNIGKLNEQSRVLVAGYLQDIARADVQRVDGVRRDPEVVTKILRSLARNVGTPAAVSVIRADVNGTDGKLKADTVSSYLEALSRLMVIEDLPAWAPSLRSRTRLRATPVRYFVDPSLAVAAVGAAPERLLADLEWFGFLFENLVVRDLRVYAQALGGRVLAYRDETGLEADAVIELNGGRWAAFEVKLGLGEVDAAARQLLRLKARVDTKAIGQPLSLAVITAAGYSYMRDDGVAVVSIGSLTA